MPKDYTELTARQEKILNIINNYWRTNCRSPSIHNLCELTGIKSTNGIDGHIRALRKKGFILPNPDKGSTRSLVTIEVKEALERL